jgi:chemotaxis signal transduction protein
MLGHAILAGMPALVLDPAWLLQAAAAATETGILVLVRHDGGRYALPCRRVAPTRSGSDLLTARLAAPDAAPLRALAPPAGDPVPPPALPSRDLLLVQIDGQRLAVPVEEVASVIPPGRPVPMHSGATGIIAHRGEVLPVLDGSRCLNGASSLDSGIALPLLRLAGPTPVAVAVQRVEGLRRIPMADIAVLPPGDPALPPPLVTAVAVLAGVPLPVVATAALCRGMARGGR